MTLYTSNESYTFSLLEEFNNYSVVIAAENAIGIGEFSSMFNFSTPQAGISLTFNFMHACMHAGFCPQWWEWSAPTTTKPCLSPLKLFLPSLTEGENAEMLQSDSVSTKASHHSDHSGKNPGMYACMYAIVLWSHDGRPN